MDRQETLRFVYMNSGNKSILIHGPVNLYIPLSYCGVHFLVHDNGFPFDSPFSE